MKNTLTKLLIGLIILFSYACFGQNAITELPEKTVTAEDLEILLGKWTGSLTYIDYSSNKPFTMSANLNVIQGKNRNQFLLLNIYPNEPKANNKQKISISKNGRNLNKKIVKSKQNISGGQVKITTEHLGKDNNMEAVIRNIYILGEKIFIIRKEVKFSDSNEWLMRNEYNYKR